MDFKNQFEKSIFDIAKDIFGGENAHNKVIQIEDRTSKSTISFAGPPKKEIDVLCITISNELKIQLLVSCKDFSSSKAEPAHVQEWCSVVNTMNKYSVDSKYIGIVVSSSGFSSGCEAWASSDNIGIIPPIKGNNISFTEQQVVSMFKRFCIAISRRLKFPYDDIFEAPNLFDFCFAITADFEGFVGSNTSSRYKRMSKGWDSNFSELVGHIIGKQIISLKFSNGKFYLLFDGNFVLNYSDNQIEYGETKEIVIENEEIPFCTKNMVNDIITFDTIKDRIAGAKITSAADFQKYIEFGVDGKLNLGLIPPNRIHIMIFDEIK